MHTTHPAVALHAGMELWSHGVIFGFWFLKHAYIAVSHLSHEQADIHCRSGEEQAALHHQQYHHGAANLPNL